MATTICISYRMSTITFRMVNKQMISLAINIINLIRVLTLLFDGIFNIIDTHTTIYRYELFKGLKDKIPKYLNIIMI